MMGRIGQLIAGLADLFLIALGIAALVFAPQVGMCLNDTSGGAACGPSGTQIFDLSGAVLIVAGATWAFAKRWPAQVGNPAAMFTLIWLIVVVVGSVWAYGMLTDWHWGLLCDTPDGSCSGADVRGAIGFFTLVGLVIAAAAVGIRRWSTPRAAR
jgi:hypothetical protein